MLAFPVIFSCASSLAHNRDENGLFISNMTKHELNFCDSEEKSLNCVTVFSLTVPTFCDAVFASVKTHFVQMGAVMIRSSTAGTKDD